MNFKFLSSPKGPTEKWLLIQRLRIIHGSWNISSELSWPHPRPGWEKGWFRQSLDGLKSWNPGRNPDPNTGQPLQLIVNSNSDLKCLSFTQQKLCFFFPCFTNLQVFACIGLSIFDGVCSCFGGWESFRCFDPLGGAFGCRWVFASSLRPGKDYEK